MKSEKTCTECGKTYMPSGYSQKYCPECRKKILRENRRKYSRTYYERHKDRILERHAEYYISHRDRILAEKAKRRDRTDRGRMCREHKNTVFTCGVCGKEFTGRRGSKKLCSDCQVLSRERPYILTEICSQTHDNCFSCPHPDCVR